MTDEGTFFFDLALFSAQQTCHTKIPLIFFAGLPVALFRRQQVIQIYHYLCNSIQNYQLSLTFCVHTNTELLVCSSVYTSCSDWESCNSAICPCCLEEMSVFSWLFFPSAHLQKLISLVSVDGRGRECFPIFSHCSFPVKT